MYVFKTIMVFAPVFGLYAASAPEIASKLLRDSFSQVVDPDAAYQSVSTFADGRKVVVRQVRGATGPLNEAVLIDTMNRHYTIEGSQVVSADVSPDGLRIAVAREDGKVGIYDAKTLGLFNDLQGHQGTVFSAKFGPYSSRELVTAGFDGTVRIWDITTFRFRLVQRLPGLGNRVRSADFDSSGTTVAIAAGDGVVLWNSTTGARKTIPGHGVVSAAFNQQGDKLATVSRDENNSVRVFDLASPQEKPLTFPHPAAVKSAKFSPENPWVLETRAADGQKRTWRIDARIIADYFKDKTLPLGQQALLVMLERRSPEDLRQTDHAVRDVFPSLPERVQGALKNYYNLAI